MFSECSGSILMINLDYQEFGFKQILNCDIFYTKKFQHFCPIAQSSTLIRNYENSSVHHFSDKVSVCTDHLTETSLAVLHKKKNCLSAMSFIVSKIIFTSLGQEC